MEPVTLTTERLVLRTPTMADAAAIEAACQDPEIPKWTTVPSPYTREHAEGFIRLIGEWWADGTQAIWCAYRDDELVASLGLHHIVEHEAGGHANLGYWTVAAARGQGYLVEAARAVIDFGFAELGLARVNWYAQTGNIPSARAARALGFRYEGLQRQGLIGPRGRHDGWSAGLLATDDRMPVDWPIL
jgi:RimJ/RimL family protein N-acetyltransferase